MSLEIERKFKIEFPDIQTISKLSYKTMLVSQTYLKTTSNTETRRVRKSLINGKESYCYTYKKDIDAYTREEQEKEISYAEYKTLLNEAITATLDKTRYCIKYNEHILEIDIFPFWKNFAILEIENLKQHDIISLPNYIKIIEEVTEDKAFSNISIAKKLKILKNKL